jgi:hypothetical protein
LTEQEKQIGIGTAIARGYTFLKRGAYKGEYWDEVGSDRLLSEKLEKAQEEDWSVIPMRSVRLTGGQILTKVNCNKRLPIPIGSKCVVFGIVKNGYPSFRAEPYFDETREE